MLLEDRIRSETAGLRDRLRHLEGERLPALGRTESRLNQELSEATENEKQQAEELESIKDSLDRKSKQKQRLAELRRKLDTETAELIDRSVEIEGRIKKLVTDADILANGSLDLLVRDDLITPWMATSLMNDNAYAQHAALHLINMAEIVFRPTAPTSLRE